jgi:phosphoglycerate dehydrogenase-like enzyme
MRVAILDDFHNIYNTTNGIRRLREHAEVAIFTDHTDPAALRRFDALIANRERRHFTREVLQKLPDVKIIAQVGNHAYHIDLAAAEECGIIIGKATGGTCRAAANSPSD